MIDRREKLEDILSDYYSTIGKFNNVTNLIKDKSYEIKDTDESIDSFVNKLNSISETHSYIKQLDSKEYTKSGLEVCLSKYWGPQPNEVGNYCIVGHR